MWIKSIQAENFKSLIGFRLDVAPFTCLIGLNGSGKSTVLQFVDFLSQLVRGNLTEWLEERHWRPNELTSRFTHKKMIGFRVLFVSEATSELTEWSGRFNTSQLHCTVENIRTSEAELWVEDGHLSIRDRQNGTTNGKDSRDEPISFNYQGSVLSQLRLRGLPHSLVEFKNYIASIKSFDLLSPQYLRQRTRESTGSIGLGGQHLSAYLYELGAEGREQIRKRLRKVYKHLKALDTKSLRSGWKQLEIEEGYSGGTRITTEARHVTDGLLRLIAILAELQNEENRFLLFDEIENGINPELIEFVVDALTSCTQQVMVTTHSPMILNYLDDELAKSDVMYLYRTAQGYTRAIPFFSIPSIAKKLTMMGPGEAFVDTNLSELADEIAALSKED